MPQETVGYVELEWTCKRCGTRNSGLNKVCSQCGAPMEESQGFEAPAEQKVITDEKKLEQATKGPDIICPYCGTRNAAGSTKCTQCGGDFSGAKSLETGKVIGALDTGPVPDVKCLVCGTMNPAANVKCAKCGAPLPKVQADGARTRARRTSAGRKSPHDVAHHCRGYPGVRGRRAVVAGRQPNHRCPGGRAVGLLGAQHSDPRASAGVAQRLGGSDPSSARKGACEQRVRREQKSAPNAQKVCSTPYLVDQGSGVAKAVQDCVYRVYENYCEYTRLQFAPVNVVVERGEGSNPHWPAASLTADQQEGQRIERYRVVFENDGKVYEYLTNDPRQYAALQAGTLWKLKVNGAGQVVDVEPAD